MKHIFKNSVNLQERFNQWLEETLFLNKPDPSIIAYNFGIYEPENGPVMYLSGSATYDPDDEE